MPSYVNPIRVTYTRTVAGATAFTQPISPPPGCTQFRVEDIQATVTTTFAGTAPARLSVGVAGNVDKFGYIDFNTTAAPTTVGLTTQKVSGTNPVYGTGDLTGTSNTITGTPKIPEVLGPVLLTMVAGTGAPAGAATADVTIAWF